MLKYVGLVAICLSSVCLESSAYAFEGNHHQDNVEAYNTPPLSEQQPPKNETQYCHRDCSEFEVLERARCIAEKAVACPYQHIHLRHHNETERNEEQHEHGEHEHGNEREHGQREGEHDEHEPEVPANKTQYCHRDCSEFEVLERARCIAEKAVACPYDKVEEEAQHIHLRHHNETERNEEQHEHGEHEHGNEREHGQREGEHDEHEPEIPANKTQYCHRDCSEFEILERARCIAEKAVACPYDKVEEEVQHIHLRHHNETERNEEQHEHGEHEHGNEHEHGQREGEQGQRGGNERQGENGRENERGQNERGQNERGQNERGQNERGQNENGRENERGQNERGQNERGQNGGENERGQNGRGEERLDETPEEQTACDKVCHELPTWQERWQCYAAKPLSCASHEIVKHFHHL